MHRLLAIGLLACGCAWAQQPKPTDAELVAEVLRTRDPLHNGNGAAELLAPGVSLDAAILATARSTTAERVVRLRAMRLARALSLAQRLKEGRGQQEVAWWLALDEIDREMPEDIRPLLLARTGMDEATLGAARQQLAAAAETARRFCLDWNETRGLGADDAARREENRKYDALEAAIVNAGPAAVPFLLSLLVVPPDIAFTGIYPEDGITGRQQVRAIFALSKFQQLKQAMPYFVMHSSGPSLTGSSNAAMAIQVLTGENFGADRLVPGNDAPLMAWWTKHRAEHVGVLDYLVRHVVQWARSDLSSRETNRTMGARCALKGLDRALGKTSEFPRDASVEVLRARLDEVESEWLLHGCR